MAPMVKPMHYLMLQCVINNDIACFVSSCQPYSIPVSSRHSSRLDWSANHPRLYPWTGYQHHSISLYLLLYQVQW